jgi:tetratricopeptide (TPR) repeat protein
MLTVLRVQGKNAEANSLLDEMVVRLQKQKPSGRDSLDFEQWLLWAERMEACEQWKQALAGYSEAARVVKNPNWSVSFRLGHGFFVVGRNFDVRGMASDSDIAQVLEQCIGHFQRALAEMPEGTDADIVKTDLAGAHAYLSVAVEKLAAYDRAVVARKEAIRILGELSKANPRHEWYRHEQANFSTTLAELLCSLDRLQEALEFSEAGIRLHAELRAEYPDKTEYEERLAYSQSVKAKIVAELERTDRMGP